MKPNTEEDFWAMVDIRADDECWEWRGNKQRQGYGRYSWHGRGRVAHRIAWGLANGPIPAGLWVLHRCDNPPCCNPGHLFLGTFLENNADCAQKGRLAFGANNGSAKLNEWQVLAIMARWLQGKSQPEIAIEYRVSQQQVSNIVNGKSWAHLFRPGAP